MIRPCSNCCPDRCALRTRRGSISFHDSTLSLYAKKFPYTLRIAAVAFVISLLIGIPIGVMFPTLGASIAGMRFFGDFERFAAISDVTAEKLDAVHKRIQLLRGAPDGMLDYASVSELAHTVDDIVVGEIENWQAVFGGKHITVPV